MMVQEIDRFINQGFCIALPFKCNRVSRWKIHVNFEFAMSRYYGPTAQQAVPVLASCQAFRSGLHLLLL